MNDFERTMQEYFGDRFKLDEPMKKHVNFRLGGPARYFVEAKSAKDVQRAVNTAKQHDVDIFLLGGGSNVLVADDGYDGLVIKLANRNVNIEDTTVTAEAGVMSAALARKTVDAGLKGFAWAISLPGTVGGAVRGNAGCFGGDMSDSVQSVQVLRNGVMVEVPADELDFGYRESNIKHGDDIVLSVTLDLEEGDKEALAEKMQDALSKRKNNQPLYAGSSGCIFKNYEFDDEKDIEKIKEAFEVPQSMIDKKQISSGWLIDKMGLKGECVGDAQISEEHGNFIINLGDATAADIAQLIERVKMEARERFDIDLEEEVQRVGF
jgi:UDP-N-acetylmuramate dehydrogenase